MNLQSSIFKELSKLPSQDELKQFEHFEFRKRYVERLWGLLNSEISCELPFPPQLKTRFDKLFEQANETNIELSSSIRSLYSELTTLFNELASLSKNISSFIEQTARLKLFGRNFLYYHALVSGIVQTWLEYFSVRATMLIERRRRHCSSLIVQKENFNSERVFRRDLFLGNIYENAKEFMFYLPPGTVNDSIVFIDSLSSRRLNVHWTVTSENALQIIISKVHRTDLSSKEELVFRFKIELPSGQYYVEFVFYASLCNQEFMGMPSGIQGNRKASRAYCDIIEKIEYLCLFREKLKKDLRKENIAHLLETSEYELKQIKQMVEQEFGSELSLDPPNTVISSSLQFLLSEEEKARLMQEEQELKEKISLLERLIEKTSIEYEKLERALNTDQIVLSLVELKNSIDVFNKMVSLLENRLISISEEMKKSINDVRSDIRSFRTDFVTELGKLDSKVVASQMTLQDLKTESSSILNISSEIQSSVSKLSTETKELPEKIESLIIPRTEELSSELKAHITEIGNQQKELLIERFNKVDDDAQFVSKTTKASLFYHTMSYQVLTSLSQNNIRKEFEFNPLLMNSIESGLLFYPSLTENNYQNLFELMGFQGNIFNGIFFSKKFLEKIVLSSVKESIFVEIIGDRSTYPIFVRGKNHALTLRITGVGVRGGSDENSFSFQGLSSPVSPFHFHNSAMFFYIRSVSKRSLRTPGWTQVFDGISYQRNMQDDDKFPIEQSYLPHQDRIRANSISGTYTISIDSLPFEGSGLYELKIENWISGYYGQKNTIGCNNSYLSIYIIDSEAFIDEKGNDKYELFNRLRTQFLNTNFGTGDGLIKLIDETNKLFK